MTTDTLQPSPIMADLRSFEDSHTRRVVLATGGGTMLVHVGLCLGLAIASRGKAPLPEIVHDLLGNLVFGGILAAGVAMVAIFVVAYLLLPRERIAKALLAEARTRLGPGGTIPRHWTSTSGRTNDRIIAFCEEASGERFTLILVRVPFSSGDVMAEKRIPGWIGEKAETDTASNTKVTA